MAKHRIDLIYFGLLISVCLIGYAVANRSEEDVGTPIDRSEEDVGTPIALPDLEPPELVLEAPFDFPYAIPTFKTRSAPTLMLSGNMEKVLSEVRASLLESSTHVEDHQAEQLAAVIE
jgi:hypothetical protein